jgi:nicotinamide-nucleotide amidase
MTLFSSTLLSDASTLLEACRRHGWRLVTAESCTGGLIAACLSEIPGASDVLDRGFVTYSNAAKHDLLDVSNDLIAAVGAVSAEVAESMAMGALARSDADITVSVTGIAGPGGGSPEKPVGLVYLGTARRGAGPARHERHLFTGDRTAIRLAAVEAAIALLHSMNSRNSA